MTWDFKAIKETIPMTTPEIVPEHLRELIARHTNVTIERCAQVVEKSPTEWATAQDRVAIAAAIRKLKDET